MIMPINNDIDTKIKTSFNDIDDLLLFCGWMSKVISHFNTHGSPNNCHFPVIHECANNSGIIELTHPLTPEERHTSRLLVVQRY